MNEDRALIASTQQLVMGTRGAMSMLAEIRLRLAALVDHVNQRHDERGQGMVEYALILVLIAVVLIVILSVVGNQVSNTFSNVSNGLNN
jgi:pilus assembly protein Flp/PilA